MLDHEVERSSHPLMRTGPYIRPLLVLTPRGRLQGMNRQRLYLLLLFAFLLLALAACDPAGIANLPAGPAVVEIEVENAPDVQAVEVEAQTERGDIPAGDTATVLHIIDGDTIEVSLSGRTQTVRYIGVDTPERGDYYYSEATQANRALVAEQQVVLVKDVSETDRFGRLLRYIYLPDGTFVNAELVAQGYAFAVTFPPDVQQQQYFQSLEREARETGRGLWGTEATDVAPAGTPTRTANCDPAYPTVCIPSPPPDLDCRDIPYRNFQVLPPDPHNFDGGRDGIGCEG